MLSVCLFFIIVCRYKTVEEPKPDDITAMMKSMTYIMVYAVTNPLLASRFFSYASLAGYEVVTQNDPELKCMDGILKGYPVIKKPAIASYSYKLAALSIK